MIKEYKFGERLSVDFDSESYYYGDEYFESWDNFGEEMADDVNNLLELVEKKVIGLIDKHIAEERRFSREIALNEERAMLIERKIGKVELLETLKKELKE